jgi:hypothetical protein
VAFLYVDSESLCDALAEYVGSALDRGEAAVLIAIEPHFDGLRARLEADGRDSTVLCSDGQMICIDAATCLAEIMHGREPDYEAFHSVVGEIIAETRGRFPGLLAYGELVNLLWHQGNAEAADRLERWWNELIAQHGFSLLCGYRVDPFDEREQAGLCAICRTHTHLIPTADDDRFEEAVERAIKDVFPSGDERAVRDALGDRCALLTHMPRGQAALLALHEMMPLVAQDVRTRARYHYRRGGPRPTPGDRPRTLTCITVVNQHEGFVPASFCSAPAT